MERFLAASPSSSESTGLVKIPMLTVDILSSSLRRTRQAVIPAGSQPFPPRPSNAFDLIALAASEHFGPLSAFIEAMPSPQERI